MLRLIALNREIEHSHARARASDLWVVLHDWILGIACLATCFAAYLLYLIYAPTDMSTRAGTYIHLPTNPPTNTPMSCLVVSVVENDNKINLASKTGRSFQT